jgi:hypothetical protein
MRILQNASHISVDAAIALSGRLEVSLKEKGIIP